MQFNLPTTKDQMYQILNDIFYYYRIRRPSYDELMLQPLDLEKMTYTPLDEDQLVAKAFTKLGAEHEREIFMRKAELTSKIEQLENQMALAEENMNKNITKINEMYDESQDKLAKQTFNTGLENSSIYIDKLTYLENEKISKAAEIMDSYDSKIEQYQALIDEYTSELNTVYDYYGNIHEKEIEATVLELKEEEKTKENEVFKYNNAIEEKLQRYDNDILKVNASLRIKYMEVNSGEFTKDQLIEMGYYDDAVRCVCGYYDTLDSVTAFQTLSTDRKAAIYLDDYYQNVVYMYGVRSGLIG